MTIAGGAVELKSKQSGSVLVITIKGKLDSVTTPNVEKQIFDLINQGNVKVILNLGAVTYISSSGMRMLFSTQTKVVGLLGKIIMCSVSPEVFEALKIAGFEHVLEYAASESEALQKF